MRTFYAVLANSLTASLTNTFVWFAITFWVFLQTKSVIATSIMESSGCLVVMAWTTVSRSIVAIGRGERRSGQEPVGRDQQEQALEDPVCSECWTLAVGGVMRLWGVVL
jgi:hypothetical protein